MVMNTITVSAAVTPTVVKTYVEHFLNRKPRKHKPTAHISYDEGLSLIRQFMLYASHHTVEEFQAFTSQWVPSPRWVKLDEVTLPEECIKRAADALRSQLGPRGIDRIGGAVWWLWRREGSILKGEWIEMREHYNWRKKNNDKGKRVILYIHGGGFFFGSVDEHRYQMQRHARKLQARVFARYRLAPQYPFPCGLLDCLAAYMYLLTTQEPETIIISGDSAGAGMVASILVLLRDQGLPLPAGGILISPWVDLTHSFPSLTGDPSRDFIPNHGFLQRPSQAWPPPNADDMREMLASAVGDLVVTGLPRKSSQHDRQQATIEAVQGFAVDPHPQDVNPVANPNNPARPGDTEVQPGDTIPGAGHDLSIMIDGKMVEIKDQIQMYATNQLISHPMVSPVLQPSLGGLPPLLILTGGGEILRDEQIYFAHKAANPAAYPPGDAYLNEYPGAKEQIAKWKPTDVQLQVWDDLCHVAPTLSFTRPAKYMYRSVAQFSAWVLARAQKTDIEILDDDDISVISRGSADDSSDESDFLEQSKIGVRDGATSGGPTSSGQVGRAGDPLPAFKNHMIRQRVDRHGNIFPLDPPSALPALKLSPNEVGVIKPGPVTKWMAGKKEWDTIYAHDKRKVQKLRVKELVRGYQDFPNDDVPPPSALAGRRHVNMPKESKKHRSWGMSLWSLWGSKHDRMTMTREQEADKLPEIQVATEAQGANARPVTASAKNKLHRPPLSTSRSRSRRRAVSDMGQTRDGDDEGGPTNSAAGTGNPDQSPTGPAGDAPDAHSPLDDQLDRDQSPVDRSRLSPAFVPLPRSPSATSPPLEMDMLQLEGSNVTLDSPEAKRPKADGIAFPFRLGKGVGTEENASMATLTGGETMAELGHGEVEGKEESKNQVVETSGVGKSGNLMFEATKEARPVVERFETATEAP